MEVVLAREMGEQARKLALLRAHHNTTLCDILEIERMGKFVPPQLNRRMQVEVLEISLLEAELMKKKRQDETLVRFST